MSKQPLVCICIPCYNNESTISETLDSIVAQDYSSLKIKVFDNASSDGSRDIIRGFVNKYNNIELFTRKETVSGEENFNTCIENAEGDYSAIFHSDDLYTATMVSEQVAFLQSHPSCGAVATHASVIDEKNNELSERFVPYEIRNMTSIELTRKQLIELSFKYGNFVTCPSVLFKSDLLKAHIQSFRGEQFKSSADLNVWFRVTEKQCFGFINKPLIKYRESNVSFSFNLSRVRVEDHDLFLVLNDYLSTIDQQLYYCRYLKSKKDFLLMKDRANTNLNRLILGQSTFQNISLIMNFKHILTSRFHMKFFVMAMGVMLLTKLPLNVYLVTLIKKVRFRND
ncbi:glycosyltransferase family 2 protein [Thiomicrorhabdus arctica]|uniref:glycosyltransferase family 2 protein n=1 Tax=Thiomicrorhabdus arctica TaxID=131540 RepID=UPI00035F768B|nr:glycosyltransferase family 2 protein [Thiomicrorhabdus arctica]